MLDYLLKYPLDTFARADWFFASGWPVTVLVGALVVIALLLAFTVLKTDLSWPRKVTLLCLQGIFAAVLLLMLWQPSLRIEDIAAGENSVSVLIDSSRSMSLVENSNTAAPESRLQSVVRLMRDKDLVSRLSEKFQTELRAFATGSEIIDELDQLDAASGDTAVAASMEIGADRTALKQNLQTVLQSARRRALAAVVVVSDGADNSATAGSLESGTSPSDSAWWSEVTATGIPVYAVGVGSERLPDDIELTALSLPEEINAGASIPVRVSIAHDAASIATLRVYDGDDLMLVEKIRLPEVEESSSGNRYVHSTAITAAEEGIMDLRFELTNDADESTQLNNAQRRILKIRDSKRRVLYVEGEPRWEYKFIRRALLDYPGIELVSLLRTSPNKFYRQGVRNPQELKNGFPTEKSELYSYDAVIIGSLEAAHLNAEQQRFLKDFVRVRGGSLLMLGGKNGLGDGGWGRSEVAQALPAVLGSVSGTFSRERRRVSLTALGRQTDWLQLDDLPESNQQAWMGLPELADYQALGEAKPGASVLLTHEATNTTTGNVSASPLLLWQRYGRGKSYLMATSGTWRWQMSLPSDDQRHEMFWQGFAAHLVSGVLPKMAVQLDREIYIDQSTVNISVTLKNLEFEPDSSATLEATLLNPQGDSQQVTLVPDRQAPGRYTASVDAEQVGEYELVVKASGSNLADMPDSVFGQSVWFVREDGRAEDFGIRRNDVLLRRLARDTGGEFLELTDIGQLPDLLRNSDALMVREQTLQLWNMPAAFLLLLLSKLIEWALRLRWNRI